MPDAVTGSQAHFSLARVWINKIYILTSLLIQNSKQDPDSEFRTDNVQILVIYLSSREIACSLLSKILDLLYGGIQMRYF